MARQGDETRTTRFRALKNGAVVELHGSLTDTTTFQTLSGLVTPGTRLDCAGLTTASWLGLGALHRYLLDLRQKDLAFTRVPAAIFRNMRLLPGFGREIDVASFEAEILGDGDAPPRRLLVEMGTLTALAAKQGDMVRLPAGPLAEPASWLCPMLFQTWGPMSGVGFASLWAKNHGEELSFWLAYTSFVGTTIDLTAVLLQTVQSGLEDLVGRIHLKVAGAEAGLAPMTPAAFSPQAPDVDAVRATISPPCTRITQVIATVGQACAALNRRLQRIVTTPGDECPFHAALAQLPVLIGKLRDVTREVEGVGAETGERVLSLKVASVLKKALMSIEVQTVTPAALEKIRDAFVLMDLTNSDDWVGTKAEIVQELDQIDNEIGKCVVLLQGFDLARQILEHRLGEAAVLASALAAIEAAARTGDDAPWQATRDELIDHVRRMMVTDQEKQTYDFFLATFVAALGGDQVKAAGGTVLLF